MNVVGDDVLEQPLIVRDHDDATVRRAKAVHAVGDGLQRVDVEARIGLVEDRKLRLEDGHLQDFVPLLLATGEAEVHVALEQLRADTDDRRVLAQHPHERGGVDLGFAASLLDRI